MLHDYDKQQWQAEQAARDAAQEKQRAKDEKAKARAARNAKRKLERLRKKLAETGELTDWEAEFSDSVTDRLDTFGSAFADPEKGRRSDALSFAQKKVVSALNKKAKGEKSGSSFKSKGGFKNKGKTKFTPRVRQIEDDMVEPTPDPQPPVTRRENYTDDAPYIPEYTRPKNMPKRPFLRIVKSGD